MPTGYFEVKFYQMRKNSVSTRVRIHNGIIIPGFDMYFYTRLSISFFGFASIQFGTGRDARCTAGWNILGSE